MIPGETRADWFFDSIDDYEPNGNDVNVSIEEIESSSDFYIEELREIIESSESEYGYKVGDKVRELVR